MRRETTEPEVIAIACADLHLSLKAPRCRQGESDWFGAMFKTINQLRQLQEKFEVSILCAGDIFDRWNSVPELTNWAIDYLPHMYAIPGQHDLPQHNYNERNKSAYETLVKAKVLEPLQPDNAQWIAGDTYTLCIDAYPWGYKIQKSTATKDEIKIAIIHEYNWFANARYPHAPKEQRISAKRKELMAYDVVIFGDNHKGFCTKVGKTTIFNCGTLMRRAADEIDYIPQVGLIMSDGKVIPRSLDTKGEKIDGTTDTAQDTEVMLEVQDFLNALSDLDENPLDFTDVVCRYITDNDIRQGTKQMLLEAIGA